jgi:tRNA (guanine6-N2)-methyltransferase
MDYFALTTRGLEDIVAAEVQTRYSEAVIKEVAYRRVLFEASPAAAPLLLELRCADDLFLLVDTWQGIGRPRSTLNYLTALASESDLSPALELCAQLRIIDEPVQFAVSASFVGKRNYTSPDMKLAIAAGIEQSHNWEYREEESSTGLSLRLFIEHDLALFGVRLAAQPLHRRPYRSETVPGSLKPPIAAALAHLAGATSGVTLLDPLCGAGTILLEAAFQGAHAIGGDNDPAALAIAQANIQSAGLALTPQQWDARQLPLADASVDAIATNLPFGRQVLSDSDLPTLYAALLRECVRVLRPGGRLALLTGTPEALPTLPELQPIEQREVSLHGQNPTIIVSIRSTFR